MPGRRHRPDHRPRDIQIQMNLILEGVVETISQTPVAAEGAWIPVVAHSPFIGALCAPGPMGIGLNLGVQSQGIDLS